MAITEDQFVEIVSEAINRHVSRDQSIAAEDRVWEARNVARTISKSLRVNNVPFIPEIAP